MSEKVRPAIKQSPGVLRHIDRLANRARGVTTIVVASLALSAAGAAVEASPAAARTPRPRPHPGKRLKQIQEYATIQASDENGNPIQGVQRNTFVINESCKSRGKWTKSGVVYQRPDQPLGKCDIGSPVTVTAGQPLKGEWKNQSGVKKVHATTRRNNHFVLDEQKKGPSLAPSTPAPSTTAPQPQPPQPPSDGGGGDPFASGNVGVDISWPQCGTANMTPSGYDFGDVGINAGLTYSINPCLQAEADNFPGNQLDLYVNTAWNSSSSHINPDSPRSCDAGDENCLAYNYGYNAGVAAVNAAIDAGVSVNTEIYEDVEPDATWSSDTGQNIQSLQGEHDALIDGGATGVGVYSYTAAWNQITGGWQNGWDSWGFTSWTTASDAMTFCIGHKFTGGPSKQMQFTPEGSNLDHDVAC